LKEGPLSSGLWLPWVKKVEREALEEAKEILEMVGLLGRWKSPASQLPLGQQKLLELGRALAMKPEIILLDEPASGLTSPEVQRLLERICQFRKGGMTFFVVEHHMDMVMEIADEVAVLHHGQLIAEGSPDLLRRNTEVIEAYLKGRKVNA
jgi:ABC-type branched-subunit amino acid transport system ATPase component